MHVLPWGEKRRVLRIYTAVTNRIKRHHSRTRERQPRQQNQKGRQYKTQKLGHQDLKEVFCFFSTFTNILLHKPPKSGRDNTNISVCVVHLLTNN